MSEILSRKAIRFGLTATDKTDTITQYDPLLVAVGVMTQSYTDATFEHKYWVPTYLGEGVAIPHGTNELREHIQHTCLGFLQFPGGVDRGGEWASVCIPTASRGGEYVEILGELAKVLVDPDAAAQLRTIIDLDNVLRLLGAFGKES